MFIATYDTRNFDFIALGETEASARKAIQDGWTAHKKQYHRCGPIDSMYPDDVVILELQPGQCMRDRELITK